MIERIIIAGAGGQGIMLLGKVLAEAAMLEGKFVTWLPAYGAEVRGGKAFCMVIISDKEIGSPYISKADSLIIMNEPSLIHFKNRLEEKGLLVLNSSLAKGFKELGYPFTDVALKLGNLKVANMVALGSYLALKNTLSRKTITEVMKKMAPKDNPQLFEINQKAFIAGGDLVKKNG
jgi:2-oxoglutarate ferredoxin oxidoreductase subunit gamma